MLIPTEMDLLKISYALSNAKSKFLPPWMIKLLKNESMDALSFGSLLVSVIGLRVRLDSKNLNQN